MKKQKQKTNKQKKPNTITDSINHNFVIKIEEIFFYLLKKY